tara:strand:+ start:2777 stop:2914 length:138 start_codon:yes stop_codon:yes gene_type:complete
MARKTSKKKIDWEWLLSLPKFQRDFEIKKMAKKEKEEDELKKTNS